MKKSSKATWSWHATSFEPGGGITPKVVEKKFVRTGRILHLHLPEGKLIRTTPEHPFFHKTKGWTAAGELLVADEIRTHFGWVKIEDLFDTGEYETVYYVRVADYHTYFVGDEAWPWVVWAHNAYSIVSSYTTGKLFLFTEGAYSANWFVPTAFLTHHGRRPNQATQNAVARDIATGFGGTLQNQVNTLRTAWNGFGINDRYGTSLNHIQGLLDQVNALRIASGGTAIDLNDYDNPALPAPPPTPTPLPGLAPAWEAFLGYSIPFDWQKIPSEGFAHDRSH